MFKVLKRLVGQQKHAEEVNFSSLDSWFEEKIKETDLSKELSVCFNEISISKSILAVAIKRIAKRVLKDIQEDQKDSVEDYRDRYVTSLHNFVKQITSDKRDVESIMTYSEVFSAAITNMSESTQNSLSVIKKFFPEEAEEIQKAFSDLKHAGRRLNELIKMDNGLLFVSDVTNLIHSIRKKQRHLEDLKENIEKEENKKNETESFRLKLEDDIDDLKSGPEYEKYDSLISKKIRLDKEMEREEENMRILFSPILKVMFEYDKRELGADRVLARQYAQNPIEALNSDKNLWVLNLLQSVSSRLPEIEPNEAKRMRIRQSILSISEDVLHSYSSKSSAIKEMLDQVKMQISRDITTTRIDDIKYRLRHAEEQIAIAEENVKKHEEAISQLNVEKDLLMLERKLNVLGKVRIK